MRERPGFAFQEFNFGGVQVETTPNPATLPSAQARNDVIDRDGTDWPAFVVYHGEAM